MNVTLGPLAPAHTTRIPFCQTNSPLTPRPCNLKPVDPPPEIPATPDLHLGTCFVLDANDRIVATREPSPTPAPAFSFVRDATTCAWAVHSDTPGDIAAEVEALARDELPSANLREPPAHAQRYASLLGGSISSGPALSFPGTLSAPGEVGLVDDLRLLERHFRGWVVEEIPGCSPIVAVLEDGYAVSVCFSARRSPIAAEAGLETAQAFRGRGLGPRVTAAWALATRASGGTPLYSTSWDNDASLAVARKLRLHAYASSWRIHPISAKQTLPRFDRGRS